jgi:hypothetical protein
VNTERWRVLVWLVATLIIAGSVLGGTVIVTNTVRDVKALDTSLLTVTGSSQQLITSDQVKWPSSFARQVGVDGLKDGYIQMKNDLELISRYFTTNGIDAKEVTLFPVIQTPVIEQCAQPPKPGCGTTPIGYRLVQNLEVNSGDVDKITRLAQDVSPVINQGVIFSSQHLEYYYSKLPDLRVQLLGAAIKDAQTRAETIAQTSGVHLGSLTTASSGVIQVTPVNSTQVSDQGSYDTTTIQKQVTAVVRASFTLNP